MKSTSLSCANITPFTPDSLSERIVQHLAAAYATSLYLPISGASQWLRRRKPSVGKFSQRTLLPACSWRSCIPPSWPRLIETSKSNGNVRLSELGILAQAAQSCPPETNLFEIGTFDGRTTINLALNSPASCQVHTLDLPPDDLQTRHPLAPGETHLIKNNPRGRRYRRYAGSMPQVHTKICQWLGDSAAIDLSPLFGTCSLVFVDGSHAHDYVLSDSELAFRLLRPGGVVIWHDYGVWPGVTSGLEGLEAKLRLGLKHLRHTSLVFWRRAFLA